jgi:predicted PurR-regulated permease PerM
MAILPSSKNLATVNISTWSMIRVILILIAFYLLYLIIDVLALLFVSLILAAALDPWVDWLHKFKIPRGVSIFFIYLITFGILSLAVILLIPALLTELNEISQKFPAIFETATSFFNTVQSYSEDAGFAKEIQESIDDIQSALVTATGGVLSTVIGIFGGVLSFLTFLVITFYITIEEEAMKRFVFTSVPQKYQVYTMQMINAIQRKIGMWLRGQLILMVVIGVMTYIGLKLIGVQYALILALTAGIAEFVPFLGPIISAIPAIFIGLTESPIQALLVVALYIIIQQLENNIIVPKIMEKSVGLNPLVIIIVLFIGWSLAGIVGAIFAIPVTTAITLVLQSSPSEGRVPEV